MIRPKSLLRRRNVFELTVAIAAVSRPRCEAFALAPAPPQHLPLPSAAAAPSGSRRASAASRPGPRDGRRLRAPSRRRNRATRRSSAVALSSSSSERSRDQEDVDSKMYYIRPYLRQLFLLCRPVNFPVVAIFHALGVHQAVRLWESAAASSSSSASLLMPLLKHPSMMTVLLSLLLVTSTSMITNDYYDARDGVDASYADGTDDDEHDHYHPLARGEVPFSIAKTFDSYLYAVLLLSSAFVPGAASRLLVLGGAIVTYLYTVHLKPRTWIKNLSCAALVAMSPVTSGLAAWHVLCGGFGIDAEAGVNFSALPFHLIFKSPLSFLVVSLFAGIMSREILMDITDCEGDARAGIETVPVKYGKRAAAQVALACSFVSGVSACGASMIPLIRNFARSGESLNSLMAVPSLSLSFLSALIANHGARKAVLSVVGSGLLLQRVFRVWKTDGEDASLAERAIRESLFSVLLVLASFV